MYSMRIHHAPSKRQVPLFHDLLPAGFPSPAADYEEGELDFNELLIKRKAATYCVRVTGDSMQGAGILPGDILVVDRSIRPADGNIVVASLDGEFTVKRLKKTADGNILLRPEHPAYRDIHIGDQQECFFFGVVTGVVRTLRNGNI